MNRKTKGWKQEYSDETMSSEVRKGRNRRDKWPSARTIFSSQPSPPPRSRQNAIGMPSRKSTTTKFNSCTTHVWKRSPALWKKLCPPALCDKNQVPSMFFLFYRIGRWKGIEVVFKGGGMSQPKARTAHRGRRKSTINCNNTTQGNWRRKVRV